MLANIQGQSFSKAAPSLLPSSKEVNEIGYTSGPSLDKDVLKEIQSLYEPRIAGVVPKPTGHPFKNLMLDEDITIENPVIRLAFSKDILDPAMDYFGNKVQFESLQVLYSYPTDGKLRESQMWHKDFGDNKSFHAIVYLNDVIDKSHGPFVFVSKSDSRKITPSILIRRIDDQRFLKELGDGEVKYFYGKSGESVFVDPAKCYHYGSRCKEGRLALFFTFNTSTPFMIMPSLIKKNKVKLFEIGKTLRPDLDPDKLKNLLRL
ncbi:hypothetical protein DBR11_20065 [Pedobacter sp. HMWF019]|nr:hypothetical protein DBR11_20065 [Pedobacter sp. HMWF019]